MRCVLLLTILSYAFINGCGISSSNSSSALIATSISGVAAAGKPIINGTVTLKDSTGATRQDTLDTQGNFNIETTGLIGPFRLKADGTSGGAAKTLYSVATEAGTVHINPITNIAVANIGQLDDPKDVFEATPGTAAISNITTASISQASQDIRNNLLNQLETSGYSGANIDPFKGSYVANGQGLDRIFDFLDVEVNKNSGAITIKNKVDNKTVAAVRRDNLAGIGVSFQSSNVLDLTTRSASEIANLIPTIPLSVAREVVVIDAKKESSESNSVPALLIGATKIRNTIQISSLPLDADYFEDETHRYVEERSTESFRLMNEILCMIDQTEYDTLVNQPTYRAQVDLNLCKSDIDSASNAGAQSQNQSSGNGQPDYELWVVNSSRADNDSPHVVHAWIHTQGGDGPDGDPPNLISAHINITEGRSESNPYGLFRLDFQAYPISQGVVNTSTESFRGTLYTEETGGRVLLKFTMQGGYSNQDHTSSLSTQATLDRDPNSSVGLGRIIESSSFQSQQQSEEMSMDLAIAFNETHFLRNSDSVDKCFSRTQYNETAWRYALYDSMGSRVEVNGGFPISVDVQGGTTEDGWIGYHGVWFPDEVTLSDGDTVTKRSYDNQQNEKDFTVVKSPGKLIKKTLETITLAEIQNIPLNIHDDGQNYQAIWTGVIFEKIAQLDQDNHIWNSLNPPQVVQFDNQDYGFGFWSEAIGGHGNFELQRSSPMATPASPTNATTVSLWIEEIVYPGSANLPTDLACFDSCIDASNLSTNSQTNPYISHQSFQVVSPDQSNYTSYVLNSSNLSLTSQGQLVALTTTLEGYDYGLRTGPMIPISELNQLACDMGAGPSTCSWKLWNQINEVYIWETGPRPWNQFTALRDPDNNQFLAFDPPKKLEYRKQVMGGTTTTYFLEYNGFGNLHGIPSQCVNRDTGLNESCDENSRWIPEFTISEGSTLTDRYDSDIEYIVKPLEIEQRLQEAPNQCGSLNTTNLSLPSITEWQDPNIGTIPQVHEAPRVIGGQLISTTQ